MITRCQPRIRGVLLDSCCACLPHVCITFFLNRLALTMAIHGWRHMCCGSCCGFCAAFRREPLASSGAACLSPVPQCFLRTLDLRASEGHAMPAMDRAILDRQGMVLSHEDAPEEELMPYLQFRVQPCRVLTFLGRAARREPQCAPQHCVMCWWQDRPMCVGP